MTRDMCGNALVPGINVDRVDIGCGLDEARAIGYRDDTEELTVINYALMRWARGEEAGADATIVSHRVDFTTWRRIIAAAVAGAA
jgi:hypothetical protein